jgi:hypothetical protein
MFVSAEVLEVVFLHYFYIPVRPSSQLLPVYDPWEGLRWWRYRIKKCPGPLINICCATLTVNSLMLIPNRIK